MTPYWSSEEHGLAIYHGDARDVLSQLPEGSVQTCVTSPPYWGLRSYSGVEPSVWGGDADCEHEWRDTTHSDSRLQDGTAGPKQRSNTGAIGWRDAPRENATCSKCGAWLGCLGLEPTPDLYVANMVEIFRGVRRVLRDDGCVFLNLGDSYASTGGDLTTRQNPHANTGQQGLWEAGVQRPGNRVPPPGLKPKDLCMVPARVALALQADGWYLRNDIIWWKRNPMPGSYKDRCTSSHEHIFLLTKNAHYFYDADSIREVGSGSHRRGNNQTVNPNRNTAQLEADALDSYKDNPMGRNKRDVWSADDIIGSAIQAAKNGDEAEALRYLNDVADATPASAFAAKRDVWQVNTKGFPAAHFAVYPEKLIEPCVLAGSAAQSCTECGAAWERVTQTEHKPHPNRYSKQADAGQFDGQGYTETGGLGQAIETQTLGFRPTCDCEADTRPSLVLDPFGGAGTTLLCAYHQGRRAVMVELSEEYCELAAKRLEEATDQGRLFEPAEVATAQPAQLVMEQDAEGMAQCTLTT